MKDIVEEKIEASVLEELAIQGLRVVGTGAKYVANPYSRCPTHYDSRDRENFSKVNSEEIAKYHKEEIKNAHPEKVYHIAKQLIRSNPSVAKGAIKYILEPVLDRESIPKGDFTYNPPGRRMLYASDIALDLGIDPKDIAEYYKELMLGDSSSSWLGEGLRKLFAYRNFILSAREDLKTYKNKDLYTSIAEMLPSFILPEDIGNLPENTGEINFGMGKGYSIDDLSKVASLISEANNLLSTENSGKALHQIWCKLEKEIPYGIFWISKNLVSGDNSLQKGMSKVLSYTYPLKEDLQSSLDTERFSLIYQPEFDKLDDFAKQFNNLIESIAEKADNCVNIIDQ